MTGCYMKAFEQPELRSNEFFLQRSGMSTSCWDFVLGHSNTGDLLAEAMAVSCRIQRRYQPMTMLWPGNLWQSLHSSRHRQSGIHSTSSGPSLLCHHSSKWSEGQWSIMVNPLMGFFTIFKTPITKGCLLWDDHTTYTYTYTIHIPYHVLTVANVKHMDH